MATKSLFEATDGVITIAGLDRTTQVREINVTGGGRDVEMVRCFGTGASSHLFQKGMEIIETSVTYVKNGSMMNIGGLVLGGSDATYPLAISGDMYQNRAAQTVIYRWQDRQDVSGTDLRLTFSSVWATGKELSLGTDGYMEETLNFKCLPVNYKEEFTPKRHSSGSPLP